MTAAPVPRWVLGVHHVQLSFPVQMQAQMLHFYEQLLGLPRWPQACGTHQSELAFAAGLQRIDLVAQPTGTQPAAAGWGHLALQVQAVDALQQRLLAHGATVLAVVPVAEGRRCYAKDPAGNTLELLQPLPVVAAMPSLPAAARSCGRLPSEQDAVLAA